MPHRSDRELFRAPAGEGIHRSVLRYTLLVAGAFLIAAPGSYLAWTHLQLVYRAEGSLWVADAGRQGSGDAMPEGAGELPASSAWIELLRSYRVLERVVVDRQLYLRRPEEDAPAFASFTVAGEFVAGTYELQILDAAGDFVLVDGHGGQVQRGTLGSPIGESLGFVWTPSRTSFAPGASVEFSVRSVRDAARDVSESLMVVTDREGSVLQLALEGPEPRRAADVLDAVMDRCVDLAGSLKRARLDETLAILQKQLEAARRDLEQADRDLEAFRVESFHASSNRSDSLAERTTEEGLRRRVRVTESLYEEVRRREEMARLAAAQATPDLRILDRASVRKRPDGDDRLPIIAAVLFGCLGAVVGGGLIRERNPVMGSAGS